MSGSAFNKLVGKRENSGIVNGHSIEWLALEVHKKEYESVTVLERRAALSRSRWRLRLLLHVVRETTRKKQRLLMQMTALKVECAGQLPVNRIPQLLPQ
jgi:hypothetical protein